MANRVRPIAVSAADRHELERLHRAPSTPSGLSRRARAVLLMAQGMAGVDIAERVGYTVVQVSRLRRRFADHGVAGLQDRPRSGRPPTITARKRAQIVALTLKPPAAGLTHWSTRDLARQAGVSHGTVHRIWRAHALKPHRVSTFKFTTDPEAEAKIYDVVGLYLNPPTNAVVLSLDEKTQIQALSRTQPLLPLRPGLPARQTHDYRRHGLTSLYAALEIASGRVIGDCTSRHTGADFLSFLKRVAPVHRDHELHAVRDTSASHGVEAAAAGRPRCVSSGESSSRRFSAPVPASRVSGGVLASRYSPGERAAGPSHRARRARATRDKRSARRLESPCASVGGGAR